MFATLSKKIVLPKGERSIHSLSWHPTQSWLAISGDDGMLRIIQKSDQPNIWHIPQLPSLPTAPLPSPTTASPNDSKEKAKASRGTSFFSLLTRSDTTTSSAISSSIAAATTTSVAPVSPTSPFGNGTSSGSPSSSSSSSSTSVQITLNHSLTYHDTSGVLHASWNDTYDKLISFDNRGRIIVSAISPSALASLSLPTNHTLSTPVPPVVPISPTHGDRGSYPNNGSSSSNSSNSGGSPATSSTSVSPPIQTSLFIEEHRNERTSSAILGVAWSGNGQRVAYVYDDGVIIVGRSDERLWARAIGIRDPAATAANGAGNTSGANTGRYNDAKSPTPHTDPRHLQAQLRKPIIWTGSIEWSTDHNRLLVATKSGEIIILDAADGTTLGSVPVRGGDGSAIVTVLQHKRREPLPHSPYAPLMTFPVQPAHGASLTLPTSSNGSNGRPTIGNGLSPSPQPTLSPIAQHGRLSPSASSDQLDDGNTLGNLPGTSASRSRTPISRSISGTGGNSFIDDESSTNGDEDIQPPSLAVIYANGWVQISRHESDQKPVVFDSGLCPITSARWNTSGEILALGGCVRPPVPAPLLATSLSSPSSAATAAGMNGHHHASHHSISTAPNGSPPATSAGHRPPGVGPLSFTVTPSSNGHVSSNNNTPKKLDRRASSNGPGSATSTSSFAASLSSPSSVAALTTSSNAAFFIPTEASSPPTSTSSLLSSLAPSMSSSSTSAMGSAHVMTLPLNNNGPQFFIPGSSTSTSGPPSPNPPPSFVSSIAIGGTIPPPAPLLSTFSSSNGGMASGRDTLLASPSPTNGSAYVTAPLGASAMLHFFSPTGHFLHSLKFAHTDQPPRSIAWSGTDNQVAVAIRSTLYFVRVNYAIPCATYSSIFVYPFRCGRKQKVCFFDMHSGAFRLRAAKGLRMVAARGRHSLLVMKNTLMLCNIAGKPIDKKVLPNGPLLVTMCHSHIASLCGEQQLFVWHYDATPDGLNRTNPKKDARSVTLVASTPQMSITAITMSSSLLVVARWDPVTCATQLHFVSVQPDLGRRESRLHGNSSTASYNHHHTNSTPAPVTPTVYDTITLPSGIHINVLHLNHDSSRLAVIDTQGHLTMYDLTSTDRSVPSLPYERRLVTDFMWSDRSPDSFTCIADTKLYVCHSVHGNIPGEEAEEELVIPTNAILCSFDDLNVQLMCLSSFLTIAADLPNRRAVLSVPTKVLRDMTKALSTCGASTGLELLKRQYSDGARSFDDALRESRLEMSSSMRDAERRFASMDTTNSNGTASMDAQSKAAATSGKWGKSAMAAAAIARKELKLQDEIDAVARARAAEEQKPIHVKYGHERLWRLLGDRAIETLELNIAEVAFIMGMDTIGIDALEELRRTLGVPQSASHNSHMTSHASSASISSTSSFMHAGPLLVTATSEEPIRRARVKLSQGVTSTPLTHAEPYIPPGEMDTRFMKRKTEVEQKTQEDLDERKRFVDAAWRKSRIGIATAAQAAAMASFNNTSSTNGTSSLRNINTSTGSTSSPTVVTTPTASASAVITPMARFAAKTPTHNTSAISVFSPSMSISTPTNHNSHHTNGHTPLIASPHGTTATAQLVENGSRFALRSTAAAAATKKK